MKQTSFIAVGATVIIIIIAAVAFGTFFISNVINPSPYYGGQKGLKQWNAYPYIPILLNYCCQSNISSRLYNG